MGYYVEMIGQMNEKTIKKYIEEQKSESGQKGKWPLLRARHVRG